MLSGGGVLECLPFGAVHELVRKHVVEVGGVAANTQPEAVTRFSYMLHGKYTVTVHATVTRYTAGRQYTLQLHVARHVGSIRYSYT